MQQPSHRPVVDFPEVFLGVIGDGVGCRWNCAYALEHGFLGILFVFIAPLLSHNQPPY